MRELSRRLAASGTPAGRRTIRRLLRQLGLGRRTARKKKTRGHHPDRNAQFENIARLRREYLDAGDPIISIDTKKKELLGNFHRSGTTFTEQTVETHTGLRVTVDLLEKIDATGRQYAKDFKQTMKIIFDNHLPKWNYRALPESG